MPDPLVRVGSSRVGAAALWTTVERVLPEEVPVALVYDGSTLAVMMASPNDLADFAIGFSLTEGLVVTPSEIVELEVVEHDSGTELRMWLEQGAGRRIAERRRMLVGPTGCGLCGVDSLGAALPPVPRVGDGPTLGVEDVRAAVAALRAAQRLNAEAHALHAAGFWMPGRGLVAAREDVGRHNALDKLVGALAQAEVDAAVGLVVLTSRLSVDLVQKLGTVGVGFVAAVSAPTGLALRTAECAGITVVAVARDDGFEVFTRPDRIRESRAGASLRAAG